MSQRSLYWRSGDLCGIDTQDVDDDGSVRSSVTTRPAGAVDISEQDYQIWQAAKAESLAAFRAERAAMLDDHRSSREALKKSARSKLTKGKPLTEDEAALLVP